MSYKRRDFLRAGANLAAGIALVPMACKLSSKSQEGKDSETKTPEVVAEELKPLSAFGLQLYTLRDDFPKDVKGVLKQVADMGYTQVEGFEGAKGIFWGMSNTEWKTYLDSIGLTMISTHCNIDKDFEKKASEASANGMKYLICPYKGPIDPATKQPRTLDNYKAMAADFNVKGEICKKNGIRFAYHNHDYSFKTIDGQIPQDVMMENTDAGLVDFEMDIYWVVAGGQDPEAWLKKYPNRFRLCHVKDRSKTPVEDNGKNSVNVGTGSIDFPKILKTAKANGMQYYIVEQEFYPTGTPLEAAKADAEYMKAVRI